MITSYILVLGISAWLTTVGFTYVAARLGQLMGNKALIPPGLTLALPILGFLSVVAAPAPMLIGCVLLVGAHFMRAGGYLPPIARWGVPLVAAVLATSNLVLPAIAHVPPVALHLAALVFIFAITFAAETTSEQFTPTSIGMLACLMPLITAPLMGAPSFIAVDIVIIASSILGASILIKATSPNIALVRQFMALIIGWLIVTSATHGAWIPAMISLLMYGGSIAYTMARNPSAVTRNAS
jgi:hypothetical protein